MDTAARTNTSAFSFLLPAPPTPVSDDDAWMREALREAIRGVGHTRPNPPVGAVVVRDGAIVARGHHARAGERHAEVVALDQVAGRAQGSTVVVTLEPCSHHGRTPPCADRLIAERVARVVVGAVDPNPRVHGAGIAKLRAAGIVVEVMQGPSADACAALIAPFSSSMQRRRPWVILKVGASLDGRIATATGASRWITNPRSRRVVHALRHVVDAVLVGQGTVQRDDPALTVRDVDEAVRRHPLRVVLDRTLSTSPDAAVWRAQPLDGTPHALAVHGPAVSEQAIEALRARGVVVDDVGLHDGALDLHAVMTRLHAHHVTSLLVEAGPRLAAALLRAQLVDEVWWFAAPMIVGGDGVAAVAPLAMMVPHRAFDAVHTHLIDDDVLTILRPRDPHKPTGTIV